MGNESSALALLENIVELEEALGRHKTAKSVQSENAWDEDDMSDNLQVVDGDHLTIKRGDKHKCGDIARGKGAYGKGIHFFQFDWNPGDNKHVVIGVATEEAPLIGEEDEIALGSDDQSVGFDLVSRQIYFNGCPVREFPPNKAELFKLPKRVLMILSMDNGTLSFKTEKENYGIAMKGLKHISEKICVAASLDKVGDTITMKYLGGSDTIKGVEMGEAEGIRFHEVCGKNIVLEDDRRRASRKNPKDNFVNATVLTERPLMDGEMFEVKLEKRDTSKWEGSWMFGVTTTSPVELHFPKEMSTCTQGHVWIYNENCIGYQGKVVERINAHLDESEPGDTVGVQKTANHLQFYVDGNRQASLLIDTDEPVYGVVDVYGQATVVSIQGDSNVQKLKTTNVEKPKTAEEYMTALEKTVAILKKKNKEEIALAKQMVGVNMDTAYHRINSNRLRRLASETLVKLDGARILTEYLEFLRKVGLDDKDIEQFFYSLRTVCWNYCDNSILLCEKFGECGLLDILIRDIKGKSEVYRQSQQSAMIVYSAFGILHNCSKATKNKPIFTKHHFVAEAKEYIDPTKNHSEIVLNAIFSMSYVYEENEVRMLLIPEPTAQQVANILGHAVESDNHQHDGWHAHEVAVAISNLSANGKNIRLFIQKGTIKPLVAMLEFTDTFEKECALNAIWSLTTDDTKMEIAATPKLMAILSELIKSDEESIEQAAIRLNMKLQVQQKMPGSSKTLYQKCEYRGLYHRFKDTLKLSKHYFDESYDMCFCAVCHGRRGDRTKYTRGTPPKEYGIPVGWYRFGLKPPAKTHALEAFKSWHRAFHGTKKDYIKGIMEVGEIVPAGRAVIGGKKVKEQPGHYTPDWKPEGFDTKQVFLSQSIRYAGYDTYATPFTFRDAETKKPYTTKIAFQVLIEPNSYTVGPETVGATTEIDPGFSNQELEWCTNQQGATIIYGLLVKMDD